MEQLNNQTISVIFFGSSKYVLPVIEALDKNFDLILVVTTEREPSDPIIKFCQKENISYHSVSSTANLSSLVNGQLSNVKCDLGVVADFGIIIPKEVLDAFPEGIINIHPSLLPKYRGPTPVQTAILNGDEKTGVTIIKIDEEVDHGPILYQEEEAIKLENTSEILLLRLFQKA
ncbi:MAG: methionyl-tRNA formyltransferase, partial [Patescibacteria group bacterium]